MNDKAMRQRVDDVLAEIELSALEDRIAPVKCEKNPEAPECQPAILYGVEQPMYGIEPDPDDG